MKDHNLTGNIGENQAKTYLIKKGYSILKTNWFYQHKEIDIIAINNNTLCFIEVKTRTSTFISPKDAVTLKKQKNLIIAANGFINKYNYDYEARFDVIEVIISKHNNININHIQEAFTP